MKISHNQATDSISILETASKNDYHRDMSNQNKRKIKLQDAEEGWMWLVDILNDIKELTNRFFFIGLVK